MAHSRYSISIHVDRTTRVVEVNILVHTAVTWDFPACCLSLDIDFSQFRDVCAVTVLCFYFSFNDCILRLS